MESLGISQLFSVRDKVVLVTGGAKGVGKLITETFLANGAKVYIASRDQKALEKSATAFTAALRANSPNSNGSVVPIVADLATRDGCLSAARQVAALEKKVHVLVNNSGSNWGAPLEQYPDAAWDKVLALNLKGVFHLTVALLPLLRAAATPEDPARVINIGSVNGIDPPVLETYAYSSSKAALHMLTKHLAGRLARELVTVNAIACGPFETKMMKATLEQFGDVVREGVALKRLGTAADVGGVCLFLSSRAGAYLTGAIVPCEGGALLKSFL
jgi:NAD(P)-dependent dehydrogenase (short-subunit alcohol dehydrogenase family)